MPENMWINIFTQSSLYGIIISNNPKGLELRRVCNSLCLPSAMARKTASLIHETWLWATAAGNIFSNPFACIHEKEGYNERAVMFCLNESTCTQTWIGSNYRSVWSADQHCFYLFYLFKLPRKIPLVRACSKIFL